MRSAAGGAHADGSPAAVDVSSSADDDGVRFDRRREVLGAIVIGVVLVGAAFAIYSDRHDLAAAFRTMGVGSLFGSGLIALIGVALGYPMWREVLRGLDVELPFAAGARVFFVSQLGKYLPGSVWPVLLQMEAGKARGAQRRTMLAANLFTVVLSLVIGLAIACTVLPLSDLHALRRYWFLLLALPVLVPLLHPRLIPIVIDRIFSLVGREPLGLKLHPRDTLRASAWGVASFALQGLHVAVLAVAVGGSAWSVWLSIGGIALAVCAGVLFLPAPAGAGVRDVVLAIVLGKTLSSSAALAVVVASRVLFVVADVLLAGLAVLFVRVRPEVKST